MRWLWQRMWETPTEYRLVIALFLKGLALKPRQTYACRRRINARSEGTAIACARRFVTSDLRGMMGRRRRDQGKPPD
jgi:hypothetical protein